MIQPDTAMYRIYDAEKKPIIQDQGDRLFLLPEGKYMIEFKTIPDLLTPKMAEFEMFNRMTTTVNTEYQSIN